MALFLISDTIQKCTEKLSHSLGSSKLRGSDLDCDGILFMCACFTMLSPSARRISEVDTLAEMITPTNLDPKITIAFESVVQMGQARSMDGKVILCQLLVVEAAPMYVFLY